MEWYCIDDCHDLVKNQDHLACVECGRRYDLHDGIPIFATHPDQPVMTGEIHLLGELWDAMRQGNTDDAVRHFSQKYNLRIDAYGTSWYFLFPFPYDGPVLEIGAGFAQDTISLTRLTDRTITLAPNTMAGVIAKRQLQDYGMNKWHIAIARDVSRLPFRDEQLRAIVMDHASAPVFNVDNTNMAGIVEEWRRILKPGGAVMLGLRNPYFPYKFIKFIRARSFNKDKQPSINQVIKSCAGAHNGGSLSVWKTMRLMRKFGFDPPRIYVPLPDENKPEIVLPLAHSEVIRYFANYLVPKYSLLVKGAITLTNIMLKLRLFRYCLPYYYLYFHLPDSLKREER